MSLEDKLKQVAESVLDEILTPGAAIALEDRLDAIKAISTLHLGLKRIDGKTPAEDDSGGPNLHEMRQRVAAAGKDEEE